MSGKKRKQETGKKKLDNNYFEWKEFYLTGNQ